MLRFGLIPNLPGETKCRLLFLKNTNRKLLQIVPRIAYFESSNSWPKNLKPLTKNPIEEFFLLKQETAISYACVQTRDGDFLRMRFVYHHHHQHHQHCNYQPAIIVLLLVISPDFSLESNIEVDTGWGAAGAPRRKRKLTKKYEKLPLLTLPTFSLGSKFEVGLKDVGIGKTGTAGIGRELSKKCHNDFRQIMDY